ncbi:hypothetical protein FE782_08290 [Paenibacillus antri]|uniref:SLH domain-containing protein n=1 Tax=Paenibacillus antri TaxID=2582848 RepID=A0A5R9GE60_9BACL|nr:hypothetical protein [Paenibacillus antri]TLS52626.1 hypothetical protein FE782_08290 [Paenibacillus antri]
MIIRDMTLLRRLVAGGAAAAIACAAAFPVAAAAAPAEDANDYALFLEEKYDIAFGASTQKGDFLEAMQETLELDAKTVKIAFEDVTSDSSWFEAAAALYGAGIMTSTTVQPESTLTAPGAVYLAVKASGLKELAYSYKADKANAALSKAGLTPSAYSPQAAKELAAAIDAGLLPEAYYKEVAEGGAASNALLATLLGKTLAFNDRYKHYLGSSSDADIYVKLQDAYRTSDLIQAPELQEVVDTALKQDLLTGYNLKDSRYDPNFVDSLSLTYGHDNLQHAVQLIGLLRSEGIDALVQFEPKTSAFIYLKEWGEPTESDSYQVVQIENGNYIAYAKEYDLSFEFETAADKARFQDIVLAYAKKNSDDAAGLIASSWWQPLYYSFTELEGYDLITNNKIEGSGPYYAQSFSLNAASEAIVDGFEALDPDVEVETYTFWVDPPFFRYLNGESM